MNENIITSVNRSDESESFGLIEEFYYAFLHCVENKKLNNSESTHYLCQITENEKKIFTYPQNSFSL